MREDELADPGGGELREGEEEAGEEGVCGHSGVEPHALELEGEVDGGVEEVEVRGESE